MGRSSESEFFIVSKMQLARFFSINSVFEAIREVFARFLP